MPACALMLLGLVLSIESPAELPPEVPEAQQISSADLEQRVAAAWQSAPDLQRHHEGYLHFLATHPALAQTERDYVLMLTRPISSRLYADFEEALLQDAEARALFDQFYGALQRDKDLRTSVEALQRTELSLGPGSEAVSQALGYLRAQPEDALRFLRAPDLFQPMPEDLAPLTGQFRQHPELAQVLERDLQGIMNRPDAQTRAVPWWQQVAGSDQRAGGAYRRLMDHFASFPPDFNVWNQRNLALAEEVQARQWIRYWHGIVRRTPGLGRDYFRTVRTELDHPRTSSSEAGLAEAWPPTAAPPPLPPLANAPEGKGASRAPTWNNEKKEHLPRPRIQRPERPARPQMRTWDRKNSLWDTGTPQGN